MMNKRIQVIYWRQDSLQSAQNSFSITYNTTAIAMTRILIYIIFILHLSPPLSAFFYNQPTPTYTHKVERKHLMRGIYLSQSSFENPDFLIWLIDESKATGINTFVTDLEKATPVYLRHLKLAEKSHIDVVPRLTVFPNGAKLAEVNNERYWQRLWPDIQRIIENSHVKSIQLDYIRFHSNNPASPQNAKKINRVIRWYNEKLDPYQVRLQLATFGITLYTPSKHIGQNLEVFHGNYDTLCPMLYPSHFSNISHSHMPYLTIYQPLMRSHILMKSKENIRIIPYIETYNFRLKMSYEERINYIHKQIQAAEDSGTDGWIAWSANNIYRHLFSALKNSDKNHAF